MVHLCWPQCSVFLQMIEDTYTSNIELYIYVMHAHRLSLSIFKEYVVSSAWNIRHKNCKNGSLIRISWDTNIKINLATFPSECNQWQVAKESERFVIGNEGLQWTKGILLWPNTRHLLLPFCLCITLAVVFFENGHWQRTRDIPHSVHYFLYG